MVRTKYLAGLIACLNRPRTTHGNYLLLSAILKLIHWRNIKVEEDRLSIFSVVSFLVMIGSLAISIISASTAHQSSISAQASAKAAQESVEIQKESVKVQRAQVQPQLKVSYEKLVRKKES